MALRNQQGASSERKGWIEMLAGKHPVLDLTIVYHTEVWKWIQSEDPPFETILFPDQGVWVLATRNEDVRKKLDSWGLPHYEDMRPDWKDRITYHTFKGMQTRVKEFDFAYLNVEWEP